MIDPDGNYLALMQLDSATEQQLNAGAGEPEAVATQVGQLDRWKQHGGQLGRHAPTTERTASTQAAPGNGLGLPGWSLR